MVEIFIREGTIIFESEIYAIRLIVVGVFIKVVL